MEEKVPIPSFLKWPGGKRKLLSAIRRYIPTDTHYFVEPFVGGGAVFLGLRQEQVRISDINAELINCYRMVRDRPGELIVESKKWQERHSKEFFLEVRAWDRISGFAERSAIERAARFLYLNKTCFNGLYRVNSKGQFNTPFGYYENPKIASEKIIEATSRYLNQEGIEIMQGDFEDALLDIKDAFVYFDPPYHPLSETASFTGYAQGGFDEQEQIRLKKVADRLRDRNCQVLVSNSDTEFIRYLWEDYAIEEIKAARAINCKGEKRGAIGELLIFGN